MTYLPLLENASHGLPAEEFGSASELLSDLGAGSTPVAVMLTCWELGTAPDEVSSANPGEIMIVQNPGGLVPPADAKDEGAILSSIMYGIEHSSVRHLIVCGHTACQTIDWLLAAGRQHSNNPFCELIESVRQRCQSVYAYRAARDWLGITLQESVLQQLINLRSHALIASRLRDRTLSMHGWMRDDETSTIAIYDPESGQFSA